MTLDEFFSASDSPALRGVDRCVYLLWFLGREDPVVGATVRELCDVIERHGHPKQNVTRVRDELDKDRRVAKAGANSWRLKPNERRVLDGKLGELLDLPKKVRATDSVLPRALFSSSRGYIEKVVHQLNTSFDHGLYDCCAVMARRLLETLLIEVYEAKGRANEIKGTDGHFFMFAGLLSFFEHDRQIHPSRNALKGLRGVKELGDLAAHNRRFLAHKNDIDRIRDGLRVAAGELLDLAGLVKAPAEA
jgi:hypothetical protein